MKVLVYFTAEQNRSPYRYALYGRFSKTGFLFVVNNQLIRYGTGSGACFGRIGPLVPSDYDELDLLLLPASDEETERLFKTCEACSKVKVPFNLQDLVMFYMNSFVTLRDIPFFECTTLNHVQSVILMLRECLDVDNVVRVVLVDMHSRQTLVDSLHAQLAVYCRPLTVSGVEDMYCQ